MKEVQRDMESTAWVCKYQDSYLTFGSGNLPIPKFVAYGEKLNNECMGLSILKIHFNTKNSHLSGKDKNDFSQLFSLEAK